MKLTSSQIVSFLQSPNPAVRVMLFYGPDAGLVRERADQMAIKIVRDKDDPFRLALLTGDAVTDDPARLADEMAAMALGGGQRLVRLRHVKDAVAIPLGKLLADMPANDTILLIETGDLEKRSKLRALCDSENPLACAIPCYVEDGAQRMRSIADILQKEGLKAPRDVLALLAESLPPDRLAMRSELEKLALFARGKKEVSIGDVCEAIHDAGAAEMDDLVNAAAGGDAKRATVLLDHLFAEQTSPVAVLRAAQRHFMRLHLARSYMDAGASASTAIDKLQPKVFWKYKDTMTRQIQRWSSAQIENFLQELVRAEAAVKRTGTPDAALCAQLLLRAAQVERER